MFASSSSSSSRARRFTPWAIYSIFLLLIADLVVPDNLPAALAFGTSALSRGTTHHHHHNYQHYHQHHHQHQNTRIQHRSRLRPDFGRRESGTRLQLSFPMEFSLTDLVSTYGYCLKYHYFPTQSVTNAVITLLGDGIAQSMEASGKDDQQPLGSDHKDGYSYDPQRGLVYFFKGLGSGIVWASWFDFAEVWSVELTQSVLSHTASAAATSFGQLPSTDVLEFATDATAGSVASSTTTTTTMLSFRAQAVRTAINIGLEQFLVTPVVFSLWDVPVTTLMRGSVPRQLPQQIREKLPPLLVANAKVWTGVNMVTYNIPLEYRLLFTSAASIVSESINAGITSKRVVDEPPVVLVAVPPETETETAGAAATAATTLAATRTSEPLGMGAVNATAIV